MEPISWSHNGTPCHITKTTIVAAVGFIAANSTKGAKLYPITTKTLVIKDTVNDTSIHGIGHLNENSLAGVVLDYFVMLVFAFTK